MKKQKILAGLAAGALAASLLAGSVAGPAMVEAASGKQEVKLSKKKLSMNVGKTKTIKVTGVKNVKWSVTKGKNLVKITANGKKVKIKALKAGTAKVTAVVTVDKKKQKFSCTVKISKKAAESGTDTKPVDTDDTQDDDADGGAVNVPAVSDKELDASVFGATNFAVSLLKQVRSEDTKKSNTLISPDSVLTCLAMVAQGADGDTRKEFEQAFGVSDAGGVDSFGNSLGNIHARLTSGDAVKYTQSIYEVADAVWTNEAIATIKPDFAKQMKEQFAATLNNEAFTKDTVGKINSWVDERTKGLIPSIIDQLDASTVMVLVNAVYFENKWQDPYEDYQVDKDGIFTKQDGTKQKVNMLSTSKTGDYFLELEGGRGFFHYYNNADFAFLALLPPEGEDVDSYLAKLDGEKLLAAYKNRAKRRIVTKIPEFKYDYNVELQGILPKLGIQAAFGEQADFSRMAELKGGSQQIYIDRVLHKTHIELDRNGTKAAAATAAMAKAGSAPTREDPPKEEVINLDRPFVYGIIDTETGLPLFFGTVDSVK